MTREPAKLESDFKWRWQRAIRDDRALTSTQKSILWALSMRMQPDGSKCFPSVETIAGDAGCAESTTRRQLGDLRELGWLNIPPGLGRTGGRKKTTTYLPTIPGNPPALGPFMEEKPTGSRHERGSLTPDKPTQSGPRSSSEVVIEGMPAAPAGIPEEEQEANRLRAREAKRAMLAEHFGKHPDPRHPPNREAVAP